MEKEYFDLTIVELQCLAIWAAKCADRALSIFENAVVNDCRPRNAINGIMEFARSGKRTHSLRKLALDAYRACLEVKDPAASAAARAASLAAASAYTHPFKDINQGKHILGPSAYAAYAIELSQNGDQLAGDQEMEHAVTIATREIADLLEKMPQQKVGQQRIDQIFYNIDKGIRNRFK